MFKHTFALNSLSSFPFSCTFFCSKTIYFIIKNLFSYGFFALHSIKTLLLLSFLMANTWINAHSLLWLSSATMFSTLPLFSFSWKNDLFCCGDPVLFWVSVTLSYKDSSSSLLHFSMAVCFIYLCPWSFRLLLLIIGNLNHTSSTTTR